MPMYYAGTMSLKQSSWSWAKNSQENRPFFTASGVDPKVSPGPLHTHASHYMIIIFYTLSNGTLGEEK